MFLDNDKLVCPVCEEERLKMSEPYEEKLFRCDSCNNDFIKDQMIEEGDLIFCKECFYSLLEKGEM
jgi:formylmethanofuran dehydrogenase subunit E